MFVRITASFILPQYAGNTAIIRMGGYILRPQGQIYSQETAGLLRDIATYKAMKEGQFLRLYPKREHKIKNLLYHLTKQGRIVRKGDTYYASSGCVNNVDKIQMAALWVLADFADRVEYHSVGNYPAKIIFAADGEVYEIVHAGQGRETLMSYLLGSGGEKPSNYLVLVDDQEQIAELDLPNVCGYCTVSPDGEVQYYQKE